MDQMTPTSDAVVDRRVYVRSGLRDGILFTPMLVRVTPPERRMLGFGSDPPEPDPPVTEAARTGHDTERST